MHEVQGRLPIRRPPMIPLLVVYGMITFSSRLDSVVTPVISWSHDLQLEGRRLAGYPFSFCSPSYLLVDLCSAYRTQPRVTLTLYLFLSSSVPGLSARHVDLLCHDDSSPHLFIYARFGACG